MAKNIVIVSSTPRKNGNSDVLAEEFARGAREAGHAVEKINLRECNLHFCIGCMACAKLGRCVLEDDINGLLPRVQNADVLVFATPIYYYEMSGQLKTFLDRMNPLFSKENRFGEVYLLASAAEDADSAMDGAVQGVRGWISCFDGVRLAGVVRATGVEGVGDVMNTTAPARAYEMGRAIR